MEIMLKGTDLIKVYDNGELKVKAIKAMSFTINKGELVVILGQSGAGKSTLLNLLGGMDTVTEGELLVDGVDIAKYSKKELIDYRRLKIGFVFQFYNLMPNLTALENVELAASVALEPLNSEDIINQVGLKDRKNSFPSQMSGGEQQRVAIARAVTKNPTLLLCDEPTGALDSKTGVEVLKLLRKQCDANNGSNTVIIVTHNSLFAEVADTVVRVKNGGIESVTKNENPKKIDEVKW
jgi:putative ABC transport system ATP-binding protein